MIGQYVDALVMRVFKHDTVRGLADLAGCVVVNGLSDLCIHVKPARRPADDQGGVRRNPRTDVVFVGDGNNVAKSLAYGCGKLGAAFVLASPPG